MTKKLPAWVGIGISVLILAAAAGCGSDSSGMTDKEVADLKAHDAHAAKPPTGAQMKAAGQFHSSLMDHPSGGDAVQAGKNPPGAPTGVPGGSQ
jgi:hypothetical protein